MQRKLCSSHHRDVRYRAESQRFRIDLLFAYIRVHLRFKTSPSVACFRLPLNQKWLIADGKIVLTGPIEACGPTQCDHGRRIDAKSGKSR